MPYASSSGVRLYYEEVGKGTPIVFVHEFSGDLRSWEAQVRHFSRRYRCIAFNARGYPPSDVPATPSKYSQKLAVDDIASVIPFTHDACTGCGRRSCKRITQHASLHLTAEMHARDDFLAGVTAFLETDPLQ